MYFCSCCHDLLMMSTNLNDISILNINGPDYHCIISRFSKTKALNLLQNADLSVKRCIIINYNFFNCV